MAKGEAGLTQAPQERVHHRLQQGAARGFGQALADPGETPMYMGPCYRQSHPHTHTHPGQGKVKPAEE